MQHPLEGLAKQVVFFSSNTAYNLDFIPDEKLDWKPAPTANSAMEIVEHLLSAHARLGMMIQGSDPSAAEIAKPANREEAKQMLVESAQKLAATMRGIDPSTLNNEVDMRFGKAPLVFVCSMPVADTIHHHGQIAYIQTLLGDTESHFDMSLFGK